MEPKLKEVVLSYTEKRPLEIRAVYESFRMFHRQHKTHVCTPEEWAKLIYFDIGVIDIAFLATLVRKYSEFEFEEIGRDATLTISRSKEVDLEISVNFKGVGIFTFHPPVKPNVQVEPLNKTIQPGRKHSKVTPPGSRHYKHS